MINIRIYAHLERVINGKSVRKSTYTIIDSLDIKELKDFCGSMAKIEVLRFYGRTIYYCVIKDIEDSIFKQMIDVDQKKVNFLIGSWFQNVYYTEDNRSIEDIKSAFKGVPISVRDLNRETPSMEGMVTIFKNKFKIDAETEKILKILNLYDIRKM